MKNLLRLLYEFELDRCKSTQIGGQTKRNETKRKRNETKRNENETKRNASFTQVENLRRLASPFGQGLQDSINDSGTFCITNKMDLPITSFGAKTKSQFGI